MTAGTVIAFDFGLQRIGVAVGELAHGIAHPLAAIDCADNARRLAAVEALVREWQPVRFVLGMPGHEGPGEHPLQAPIARFARRLRARFGLEVDTVDETLSSWSASRSLSAAGVRAKNQKRMLDSMAACAILTTWFEARPPGSALAAADRA